MISSSPDYSFFHQSGFQVLPHFIGEDHVASLGGHLSKLEQTQVNAAGVRNLLNTDSIQTSFANRIEHLEMIRAITNSKAFPVRMIVFDKSAETNWAVPWHQDLNIAVRGKSRPSGYGPWSIKKEVPHVVPPLEVLKGMVTLRVHIDPCPIERGPLRVVTGSHQHGILDSIGRSEKVEKVEIIDCIVNKGDAILMHPLTLHSSRKATEPSQRRVIHIEYATTQLPEGLDWFFA